MLSSLTAQIVIFTMLPVLLALLCLVYTLRRIWGLLRSNGESRSTELEDGGLVLARYPKFVVDSESRAVIFSVIVLFMNISAIALILAESELFLIFVLPYWFVAAMWLMSIRSRLWAGLGLVPLQLCLYIFLAVQAGAWVLILIPVICFAGLLLRSLNVVSRERSGQSGDDYSWKITLGLQVWILIWPYVAVGFAETGYMDPLTLAALHLVDDTFWGFIPVGDVTAGILVGGAVGITLWSLLLSVGALLRKEGVGAKGSSGKLLIGYIAVGACGVAIGAWSISSAEHPNLMKTVALIAIPCAGLLYVMQESITRRIARRGQEDAEHFVELKRRREDVVKALKSVKKDA